MYESSKWGHDQKVGAITSAKMRDVRASFYDFKAKLYTKKYQGDGDIYHSALEFSNFIGNNFYSPELKHTMQLIIEKAMKDEKDLWKDERWLFYIRQYADIEFEKKVSEIRSAIAVLSSMDGSKKKKEVIHPWE